MARAVTGRDLVLIVGGLFLVAKSTHEIHDKLEGHEGEKSARVGASYASVLLQIMALDVVFSLDSVITAVGRGRCTCVSPTSPRKRPRRSSSRPFRAQMG